MKIWGLFLTISLLFFACTNPKPTPQAPNVNWTQLDEPPLFPDCPQDDVKLNWDCFTKTLEKKLQSKDLIFLLGFYVSMIVKRWWDQVSFSSFISFNP